MARAVALSNIVERARIHADMQNSGFASDAKCLALLNEIYPKLYDLLTSADENYYVERGTISIGAASVEYDLPDDFYKLIGVDFTVGGGAYSTLKPYPEAERNDGWTLPSLPAGTVRIRYVPAPPVFTSLDEEVDGIAGWDRMLSLLLGIDLLDSEESNTDRLYRKYAEEVNRIETMSDRDIGMPARVADIYVASGNYDWLRYRLYGDKIEFVSTEYIGV